MADDAILGFTDLATDENGQMWGTAHRESGATERTKVLVTVERTHERDGEVIAQGVVASSADGTVSVGDGACV